MQINIPVNHFKNLLCPCKYNGVTFSKSVGKIKKALFLYFTFIMFTTTIYAQDSAHFKADDNTIQQQMESFAESTDNEENDFTNLVEMLNYYKTHPINLNKTTHQELQQLNVLNDVQITNLLEHIEKNGALMVVYELQTIKGFNQQIIDNLLPYIYVSDNVNQQKLSANDLLKNGQHQLILRYGQTLEQQKGFTAIDSASLHNSPNSRYIGSPQKIYTRYNYSYNNRISFGITAEKNQGELFLKNNQRVNYSWYNKSLNGNQQSGFDFYSTHLFVKNTGVFKTIAVGDYQLTFGQGLTVWNGLAFGKSAAIMSVKRNASGIRPYKSADENRFMRGIATTLYYKNFEATAFVSHKKIDGNILDTSATGETLNISALQQTGYHTTPSEIYDKHSVTQTIVGGNVSYTTRKLSVGVTGLNYELNKGLNRSLSTYNQFEFSSDHNFNVGVNYNLVFRNFNFFGEQAIGKNGGLAFINGILLFLDERLYVTILQRKYQRNYQNFMSNAFGQNSTNANENGIYTGVNVELTKNLTLAAYYDRFEFPWLKYQVNAPSVGNEYLAQLTYTPSKKTTMYIRVRKQSKQQNTNDFTVPTKYIVPVNQSNYRFNISYFILPALVLRNRVEFVQYKLQNNTSQNGYLMYQDIIYNKIGSPISLSLRYALFQTDSYDARIYAYENDVQGYYSIPSYYYRGSHFHLMMDYNITKNIELWLRYSQTYYDNKNVISEGALTEIDGNTKSEVRAQVALKF